jgi:hypothetical protein
MPMSDHMNMPWYMGGAEWLELTLFWTAAIVVLTALIISLVRQPAFRIRTAMPVSCWRNWPEVKLVMLALPLELLWEIAQFPLYDVWHQNDWAYIFYGLAHCTLGDLLILLILYEVIALLNRNRAWYAMNGVLANGLLFTLLGAGYTIYSEIMNVRIKGTWGYTELMPIVPIVNIGGMPFLQWLLIPPVLLWLMRITNTAQQIRE